MTAKSELQAKLIELFPEHSSEIADILSCYDISPNVVYESTDLSHKINCFLTAKRIDGLTDKTLKNYQDALRLFAGYCNKPVQNICTDDLREYISFLDTERHLAKSSIQTYINILRSFFQWLCVEEIIQRNPMNKIKSLKIDRTRSKHPLSSDQLETLRDACTTYKESALLEFLVSSGCRLGEVVGLRVDQIDWQSRRVCVIGKGNKQREVYFSTRAKYMLQKYISERKGGEALFSCTRYPYSQMSARSVEKLIANIGLRAKSKFNIHPHLMRHTFASTALNGGMDLTVIQHLLGHSDPKTTLIYAELSPRRVQAEYEKIIA